MVEKVSDAVIDTLWRAVFTAGAGGDVVIVAQENALRVGVDRPGL